MKRNLSPYDSVMAWLHHEKGKETFHGETLPEFLAWKSGFKSALIGLLGKRPEQIPLNPEIVETVDMGNYIREKVYFDVDKYSTLSAYILIPKSVYGKTDHQCPAVIAAHGHGRGKLDVCGIARNYKEYAQNIRRLNYAYGVGFVVHNYVVIAPDWRGFGERESPEKWVRKGRDKCNINYLGLGYLGYHLLTLQIWDGMRCIDYLQTRPEVDPNRIGCAGLSFGGTMTTYIAALDDRIKVACISGYLSTMREDALTLRGQANTCGSQYMPGLLTLGDIADVAGLICPKALMVEMGQKDNCFIITDALKAYNHLQTIYRAGGAIDKLDCDIHPGSHAWSGVKAFPWFDRWL